MSTTDDTTFKITNTKFYVPVVTLSSKNNVKLVKVLAEEFKRPAFWNEYQTKIKSKNSDNNNLARFPLDASFQGVRRLFVLAFNNTTDNVPNSPINNTNNKVERNSPRKYFLLTVSITNYNVLIDGDDCTTGCLLDYQYFKDLYNLIAVDLSKQKELDADSRANKQTEFYGMLKTK